MHFLNSVLLTSSYSGKWRALRFYNPQEHAHQVREKPGEGNTCSAANQPVSPQPLGVVRRKFEGKFYICKESINAEQ